MLSTDVILSANKTCIGVYFMYMSWFLRAIRSSAPPFCQIVKLQHAVATAAA